MRSIIALVAFAAIIVGNIALLLKGGAPERRYERSACQYRMIYEYTSEGPMGLVTLGGSRIRVATNADHFDSIIADLGIQAKPVHNLSHSTFSYGKEYVILRDFLEHHTPKVVLIQAKPRELSYGTSHRSFSEIARLSDIPVAVHTLWPENKVNALLLARNILFEHLKAFDKVGKPHRETNKRNCDKKDYRLSVDALHRADIIHQRERNSIFEWDLGSTQNRGVMNWFEAYQELSKKTGTQFIFILMTSSIEPRPSPNFEAEFEQITGFKLITLDPEIYSSLAYDGRRDSSHVNAKGRDIFLPWLIPQIQEKCTQKEGCL